MVIYSITRGPDQKQKEKQGEEKKKITKQTTVISHLLGIECLTMLPLIVQNTKKLNPENRVMGRGKWSMERMARVISGIGQVVLWSPRKRCGILLIHCLIWLSVLSSSPRQLLFVAASSSPWLDSTCLVVEALSGRMDVAT